MKGRLDEIRCKNDEAKKLLRGILDNEKVIQPVLDLQLLRVFQAYDCESTDWLIAELEKAWAENERLKEALKWYADPHNYGVGGGSSERIMTDHGQRARKVMGRER
jgi:hypothetical protein